MLNVAVAIVLVAVQVAAAPRVLGPDASDLTAIDATAIAEALAGVGAHPWLLMNAQIAPIGASGDRGRSVAAYLPPDVDTPEIRRGRIVAVRATADATGADASAWTVDDRWTGVWAQVAIPDRPFDDVRDESDENRPFGVLGEVSDRELLDIVQFVRSQPALASAGAHADATMPEFGALTLVGPRDTTGTRVYMARQDGRCLDVLLVQQRDGDWHGTYGGQMCVGG